MQKRLVESGNLYIYTACCVLVEIIYKHARAHTHNVYARLCGLAVALYGTGNPKRTTVYVVSLIVYRAYVQLPDFKSRKTAGATIRATPDNLPVHTLVYVNFLFISASVFPYVKYIFYARDVRIFVPEKN